MRRKAALGGAVALVLVAGVVFGAALQVRRGTGARAVTIGSRTWYLVEEPSLYVRLHEAVHRRQHRTGGWMSWLRYAFVLEDRLRMEAEADVLARCAQGLRTEPGPETWARSRMHETIYAFWWWERKPRARHDPVGEWSAVAGDCGVLLEELDEEGRLAWMEAAERVAARNALHTRTAPRPTAGSRVAATRDDGEDGVQVGF
ncbi:MAG: hypothetical protein AMXMBFR53_28150 [Gemmatimonadota bacterium]